MKRALVNGASRGLGLVVTRHFPAEGRSDAAVARNVVNLAARATAHPVWVLAMAADLADPAAPTHRVISACGLAATGCLGE